MADRRALTLSGALLLGGFVVNAIQRMLLHPSGAEDDHEAIFTEYAESDVWVATHFAEFLLVLVMITDDSKLTAPLGLSVFQGRNTSDLTLMAAGSVIVALPVVIVYVFLQRHFIRGMLSGAVKG